MASLWLLLKTLDTWAFGQIDYIEKLQPRIVIDLRSWKNIHCMVLLSSFLKNTQRLGCWEQNPGHRRAYPRDEVPWGSLHLPLSIFSMTFCYLFHMLLYSSRLEGLWSRGISYRRSLFKFSVIKELEWLVIATLGNAHRDGLRQAGKHVSLWGQWVHKQRVELSVIRGTTAALFSKVHGDLSGLLCGESSVNSLWADPCSHGSLHLPLNWEQRAKSVPVTRISWSMFLVWC